MPSRAPTRKETPGGLAAGDCLIRVDTDLVGQHGCQGVRVGAAACGGGKGRRQVTSPPAAL